MEKLAEYDLTYFFLRHVVMVVTAVTTISLTVVDIGNSLEYYLKPLSQLIQRKMKES
jgi:hypothetical protein